MSHFADQQTLDDLNIPGRHKNKSIARLFDVVVTAGGRKLMDGMFENPMTDFAAINARSSIFRYFGERPIAFPFSHEEFNVMENYLSSGSQASIPVTAMGVLSKKMLQIAAQDQAYEQLNADVSKTIELLNRFFEFVTGLPDQDSPYQARLDLIKAIYNHPKLAWLIKEPNVKHLSPGQLIKYDYRLRTRMYEQLKQLINHIYQLDVYIAVSGVARKRGFTYALALPKSSNTLTVTNLYHPAVENAIGNTLVTDGGRNVIFLTGANMAGKSTLMKSFGISVYLAHMGFPVAASHMEFSVKDGLYTSINVPDNLHLGYSHFYAEVLRVKTVAEEVASGKDLVVIFDELFKGTNVKDAYDATLAITEAFSDNRSCFFVISTHIVEVGETLRARCGNFTFTYLPTIMDGLKPGYTYLLKTGISSDRHGMMIIEKEGILDIISSGNHQ